MKFHPITSDVNRVNFEAFFVDDRIVTYFEKTHFISGVIFIDGYFSGIPQNHSSKIFINGHFSVTASVYD